MRQISAVFIISAFLICLSMSHATAACNVCHSKNPKMVRMHQELGYKDCFKCHRPGGKKTSEEQKEQMAADPLCIGCHRK
jgi:predicted CXXCH cytochrome family protein